MSAALAQSTAALDPVYVTGTRIRTADALGPSPVTAFDRDAIRATGAMTLADFLHLLPQNTAGIGVGRGSVPNEFNPEFGQRTESTLPAFDFVRGASAAPPGQPGVSGAGLRGLGSGSTLVLLDGRRLPTSGEGNRSTDSRQGFVNLNSIPLGMIERVELVTDGASAVYGADAVAGVINIVLRKDYTGAELETRYRGTWHGGARERQLTLTTGFARGDLRGTLVIDTFDRAGLKAAQRSFSKNQDHSSVLLGKDADGRPVFGRDLRLNWGYPAVVQAVSGDLAGVFDASGNPVRVALTPEGTDGRGLAPSQFAPGTALFAARQRRGDTAAFLDLVPPTERGGVSGTLSYTVNERLELYGRWLWSETRGLFSTQPAVSAAAARSGFGNFATVVPAAYNPFGQDVMVGLIHHEFGSIMQATRTRAHSLVAGAGGQVGDTWRWDAAVSWGGERIDRRTRDFDGAAFTAALAHPDSARRLNPFADARVTGSQQAGLYETLAVYSTRKARGERLGFDVVAEGEVARFPAGGVGLALGAEVAVEENATAASPPLAGAWSTQAGRSQTEAVFAELRLPIFGPANARPGLRRLDLHVAGRREDLGPAGTRTTPKLGFSWAPHATLLLRGGYSTGVRAPDLTEYQIAATTFSSVVDDPRRLSDPTNVRVRRGSNAGIQPETSANQFIGLVFEPSFVRGLKLEINHYVTRQDDAIRMLSPQALVDHEVLFPGRITRAEADASDRALGQPGAIAEVDSTLINFGRVRNESVDLGLSYRLDAEPWGEFRINLMASHTLAAEFEVAPGEDLRDDRGDTLAPPKWTALAGLSWQRGPWHLSGRLTHISAFESNHAGNLLVSADRYPARTIVDLRGSFEFAGGVWRGRGRGLRLGAGIGNVFDQAPPFSDTIFGYNGGLHQPHGRTYEFFLTVPY